MFPRLLAPDRNIKRREVRSNKCGDTTGPRVFPLLVVVFYIVRIFHSQQTRWFESEAQLRLENDVDALETPNANIRTIPKDAQTQINPPEAGPPRQTPRELCLQP